MGTRTLAKLEKMAYWEHLLPWNLFISDVFMKTEKFRADFRLNIFSLVWFGLKTFWNRFSVFLHFWSLLILRTLNVAKIFKCGQNWPIFGIHFLCALKRVFDFVKVDQKQVGNTNCMDYIFWICTGLIRLVVKFDNL